MTYAPIALFVYNRPWHTQQTVESLLKNTSAQYSHLYIFSDAPRNTAAIDMVAEVRSYIHTIEGFRSITIIEREINFGLARSIIDGVTYLCEEFGSVIVLEDDLIVHSCFLKYMNDALLKYENQDSVMQISGHMFPVPDLEADSDAIFLPYTASWGWATWDRAWCHFDANAGGYERLKHNFKMRKKFDLDGAYPYFRMLKSQINGEIDSWAIRWYLSVFLLNGKVLYPVKTLVYNIGLDGSGVHCRSSKIKQGMLDGNENIENYPTSINIYSGYFKIIKFIRKQNNLYGKISSKFRGFFAR